MFLKLIFLMVFIVTLQIDLNCSYRYSKGINDPPHSQRSHSLMFSALFSTPLLCKFKRSIEIYLEFILRSPKFNVNQDPLQS